VENTAAVAPAGMFGGFFIPLELLVVSSERALEEEGGSCDYVYCERVHERVRVFQKNEGGGSIWAESALVQLRLLPGGARSKC
jgi:hypothetical protein